MGWVVNATPRPLYSRERPGTHCIEGLVGRRAGLDGCGKSRPHRDSIEEQYIIQGDSLARGPKLLSINAFKCVWM
jgi:hypothetical protein